MSSRQQQDAVVSRQSAKLPQFPARKASVGQSPARRNRVDTLPGVPTHSPGRPDITRRGQTGADKLVQLSKRPDAVIDKESARDARDGVKGFESPQLSRVRAQVARDEVLNYMQQRRQQRKPANLFGEPRDTSFDELDHDDLSRPRRSAATAGGTDSGRQPSGPAAGELHLPLVQPPSHRTDPAGRHTFDHNSCSDDDDLDGSGDDQSPTRHVPHRSTPQPQAARSKIPSMAAQGAAPAPAVAAASVRGREAEGPASGRPRGGPPLSPGQGTAAASSETGPAEGAGELTEDAFDFFKREIAARVIQTHWRRWQAWKAQLRREAEERILQQLLADESGLTLRLLLGGGGATGELTGSDGPTAPEPAAGPVLRRTEAGASASTLASTASLGSQRSLAAAPSTPGKRALDSTSMGGVVTGASRAVRQRPGSASEAGEAPAAAARGKSPARSRLGSAPVHASPAAAGRGPLRPGSAQPGGLLASGQSLESDGCLDGADGADHRRVQPSKKHVGGHAVYTFEATPRKQAAMAAAAAASAHGAVAANSRSTSSTVRAADRAEDAGSTPEEAAQAREQYCGSTSASTERPSFAASDTTARRGAGVTLAPEAAEGSQAAASSPCKSRPQHQPAVAEAASRPGSPSRPVLSRQTQPSLDADTNPAMASPALSAANSSVCVGPPAEHISPTESRLAPSSKPRRPSVHGGAEEALSAEPSSSSASSGRHAVGERGHRHQCLAPAAMGDPHRPVSASRAERLQEHGQLLAEEDLRARPSSSPPASPSSHPHRPEPPRVFSPSPQRQPRCEALQRLKRQGSQRASALGASAGAPRVSDAGTDGQAGGQEAPQLEPSCTGADAVRNRGEILLERASSGGGASNGSREQAAREHCRLASGQEPSSRDRHPGRETVREHDRRTSDCGNSRRGSEQQQEQLRRPPGEQLGGAEVRRQAGAGIMRQHAFRQPGLLDAQDPALEGYGEGFSGAGHEGMHRRRRESQPGLRRPDQEPASPQPPQQHQHQRRHQHPAAAQDFAEDVVVDREHRNVTQERLGGTVAPPEAAARPHRQQRHHSFAHPVQPADDSQPLLRDRRPHTAYEAAGTSHHHPHGRHGHQAHALDVHAINPRQIPEQHPRYNNVSEPGAEAPFGGPTRRRRSRSVGDELELAAGGLEVSAGHGVAHPAGTMPGEQPGDGRTGHTARRHLTLAASDDEEPYRARPGHAVGAARRATAAVAGVRESNRVADRAPHGEVGMGRRHKLLGDGVDVEEGGTSVAVRARHAWADEALTDGPGALGQPEQRPRSPVRSPFAEPQCQQWSRDADPPSARDEPSRGTQSTEADDASQTGESYRDRRPDCNPGIRSRPSHAVQGTPTTAGARSAQAAASVPASSLRGPTLLTCPTSTSGQDPPHGGSGRVGDAVGGQLPAASQAASAVASAAALRVGGQAVAVDVSVTAEKLTSILKYLDEVEQQAEQEATCAALAPALLVTEPTAAAAVAAALLPGHVAAHAARRSTGGNNDHSTRRHLGQGSNLHASRALSRPATAHPVASQLQGLQTHRSQAGLSDAFGGRAPGRRRSRSLSARRRSRVGDDPSEDPDCGANNADDRDGLSGPDDDNDGAASVDNVSAVSGITGRPAFLAESVYENVRNKIRRLQDDIKQRDARIQELCQEVDSLQAAQRTCLLEADARLSEMLAAQRAEYEAAVARHLAFVDRLLADKEALASRAEQLAEQVKGADERQERTIAKLKEGWAVELKRQKDAWAAAEKQRREAWMQSKAAEIKDVTVKGLEGEVQKLLTRHRAELSAAQQAAADEARRHLDAYVAQNEVAVRQLKERMAREAEEAVEKERAVATTRLREVSERYEQQLQTQRMRLVADADLRLEQLEQARKEDKKRYEESLAAAREAAEARQKEAEEDWRREKEALRKAHDKQIESLREQYETGQEGWRAAMAERARKEVSERVAAIREKLLQERNEEVQAVMTRLEGEHVAAMEALKEDFRRREEAAAARAAAALKEARKAEAKMAERFRNAGVTAKAAEDRLAATELTVQEMRRELESRSTTIRWLEAQVSAAKEDAAARERDVRSLGDEKAAVAAEVAAAVARDKQQVEARLAQAMQETLDLKQRHSAEMAAVEARVRGTLARKDEVISGLREQLAAMAAELHSTQEVLRQQQEELGGEAEAPAGYGGAGARRAGDRY